jgi:hypothetical protein
MRVLLVALVSWLCLSGSAQAQMPVPTTQMLMPNPLGIVLMVGKWIYDSQTRQEVYYIEVAGIGVDPAQARNNGFRLAVEQALGTLISSETEVRNGRIVRDEIISYAAGFVTRFEIVGTEATAQGTRVNMRVWVERSALANRLLARSDASGTFDGAAVSQRLDSINQERTTGDALLQQVLNDFPRRAFDLELGRVDIIRENRQAHVRVPFRITWSQHYLRSVWTALNATSQRTSSPASIIAVNSGNMFRGYGGQARFDDTVKFEMLYRAMVASEPNVLITVKNQDGSRAFSGCYRWQELDHLHDYHERSGRFVQVGRSTTALLDGSFRLDATAFVPAHMVNLTQASGIELQIVPKAQCPKL